MTTKPEPATKPEPVRVVMLWPADLKREIQSEVGRRGLTSYVLDAVHQKRAREKGRQVTKRDPNCTTCGTPLVGGSCWVCG